MVTNRIRIEMTEGAEVRLAQLVAELQRQGLAFRVEERYAPGPEYVIEITGY